MPTALSSHVAGRLRLAFGAPRLLLALKTALAVGIAWRLAPYVPGVADQYPYYAPLGALVSMYPTLMSSVRTGLQTLLGLAAGIGLATLVIVTTGPSWWTIPIIVGVGIVVSGTGWFGAGREYVPMAALFVLIIGGQDADDYSLGYLVQMAVGVVVGLAVNLLVAPRISSVAAGRRIDELQHQVAAHLHDMGTALRETWPPEHEAWARDADSLTATVESVRDALAEGDESRKGNPRALFNRRDTRADHRRVETLDRVVFHVRDLSEALADSIWSRPGAMTFDPALAEPLADACDRVGDALDETDPTLPRAHRALGAAARAVRQLVLVVDERSEAAHSTLGPGVLSSIHLRRIIMHLRADGRPADAADDEDSVGSAGDSPS